MKKPPVFGVDVRVIRISLENQRVAGSTQDDVERYTV